MQFIITRVCPEWQGQGWNVFISVARWCGLNSITLVSFKCSRCVTVTVMNVRVRDTIFWHLVNSMLILPRIQIERTKIRKPPLPQGRVTYSRSCSKVELILDHWQSIRITNHLLRVCRIPYLLFLSFWIDLEDEESEEKIKYVVVGTSHVPSQGFLDGNP